jgi:CHAD domain-containing protein
MDSIMILLRKPVAQFGPKDFHSLRVDIKRIKALLFLVDASTKDFKKKKYYKPFRQLFRQAGKVRELQLQEAMLKKYGQAPALTTYFNQLDLELQHEQQKFFALPGKQMVKALNAKAKKVEALLGDVKIQAVKDYLQDKRENIRNLLATEKLKEKDVHLLRKRIKELYYLQRIFKPDSNRLDIADDFQELLGKWHDCQVIRQDLIADAQNHKRPPEEIKAIMALHKKISGQASRLLEKIQTVKNMV